MSIVKRSSGEIKQELFTNLRRLTDTAHFDYWPVLVNLAKGARLQEDVVNFMVELGKLPRADFLQTLVNGGFGGTYVPQKQPKEKFTVHENVATISSAREFYNFLQTNNVLEDKNAHRAILAFALHANIEQIKRFASGESLMADAIKRE